MSSPPSTSGSDPEGPRHRSDASPTSALALSGLLKVQRRWSLAFSDAPEEGPPELATAAAGGPAFADSTGSNEIVSAGTGLSVAFERRPSVPGTALRLPTTNWRSLLPVHLEDAEWSRLAIGAAAELLATLGVRAKADVIQLDPDSVTVHVPTSQTPEWPFSPGPVARTWTLPRDSRAGLPPRDARDHQRHAKRRPGDGVGDPRAPHPRRPGLRRLHADHGNSDSGRREDRRRRRRARITAVVRSRNPHPGGLRSPDAPPRRHMAGPERPGGPRGDHAAFRKPSALGIHLRDRPAMGDRSCRPRTRSTY